MNNISNIILTLLAAVAGIKPTNSIANDVSDAEIAINVVQTLDPKVDLSEAKAVAQNVGTLAQKVASGSYALVGTVGATFEGAEDKIVTIAFRQYYSGGAPADSDAAKLKDMLGL